MQPFTREQEDLYRLLTRLYGGVTPEKRKDVVEGLINKADLTRGTLRQRELDDDPWDELISEAARQNGGRDVKLCDAVCALHPENHALRRLALRFRFDFESARVIADAIVDEDSRRGESPFRGLEPYGIEDVWRFCGRDAEVKDVLMTLEQDGRVVILGESGSGKSSLAMAGVLARLQRAAGKKKVRFLPAVFRPGPLPWETLEGVLVTLWDDLHPTHEDTHETSMTRDRWAREVKEEMLRARVGDSPNALWELLRKLTHGRAGSGLGVALLIDQMEELATYGIEQDGRSHMVAMIARAFSQHREERIRLLATVRSDRLPDLQGSLGWSLSEPDADHHDSRRGSRDVGVVPFYALRPMGDHATIEALTEAAAEICKVDMDPELIPRIVDDAGRAAASLALINLTLDVLWRTSEKEGLTLGAYESRRGIRGVLDEIARAAWGLLTEDQQKVFGRVLRFVVDVDRPGGAPTPRRVKRSELAETLGGAEALDPILRQMRYDRLLVVSGRDDEFVELVHGSLVRGGIFASAIDKARRKGVLEVRTRLRLAVANWVKNRDDARLLWDNHPKDVDSIEGYTKDGDIDLTKDERDFLDASRRETVARRQEAERQQRKQNYWVRTLVVLLVLVIGLGVVAGGGWRKALREYENAKRAEKSAEDASVRAGKESIRAQRAEMESEGYLGDLFGRVFHLARSKQEIREGLALLGSDFPSGPGGDFVQEGTRRLLRSIVSDSSRREARRDPERTGRRLRILADVTDTSTFLRPFSVAETVNQHALDLCDAALRPPHRRVAPATGNCPVIRECARLHEVRGILHEIQGQHANAVDALRRAVTFADGSDPTACPRVLFRRRHARFRLGLALAESGQLDAAVGAFNEALLKPGDGSPDDQQLSRNLPLAVASAQLRLGRITESHNLAEELIQHTRESVATPTRLAPAAPPRFVCASPTARGDLREVLSHGERATHAYARMLRDETLRPVQQMTHHRRVLQASSAGGRLHARVQIDAPLSHNVCFPDCQVDVRFDRTVGGESHAEDLDRLNSCVPCRVGADRSIAGVDTQFFVNDRDGQLEFDTASRCMEITSDDGSRRERLTLTP